MILYFVEQDNNLVAIFRNKQDAKLFIERGTNVYLTIREVSAIYGTITVSWK